MSYIRVEGLPELREALQDRMKKAAIKKAVRMNTAELQQQAQRMVPVDTGTLKRSIQLSIEDDGMTGKVTAGAEYAGYVEYGTRYMSAQPFMAPSLHHQEPILISDLRRIMN